MDHSVLILNDEEVEKLRLYLEKQNFKFRRVDHAIFGAAKNDVSLTLYKSKKLVVQGKNPEKFRIILEKNILDSKANSNTKETESYAGRVAEASGWIGTDESGKGDYFGPLVIAGVYVDNQVLPRLYKVNIRDSKRVSDNMAKKMAETVREACPFSVVSIGPERYNKLIQEMKNLNRLLAWGHARVIENLLSQVDCDRAITDQFGDQRFVLDALMKKGKTIKLEQRPKAEDDIAVASASVLARSEFLIRLKKLSTELSFELPKGASKGVEEAARFLAERHGSAILKKVAKLHFKTTKNSLNPTLGLFD